MTKQTNGLEKFGDKLQSLSGAEAALIEETKKLPL